MPKNTLFVFLLILAAQVQGDPAEPACASACTPLETVNLRMQRYNARDLEALLKLYADDVKIYAYPDHLLGKGKPHLRGVLEETFKDSTPVTISQQLVEGGHVVNEERVSYGGKARHSISIYEVRDGLIRSVRFIR